MENIEYRFKESTKRGTPLEIVAPKLLVDEATSSGYGPLLEEAKAPDTERLMGKHYDGRGNVTLDFDLGTNGRDAYRNSSWGRALQTMALIAQLDGFAAKRNARDPRLAVHLPSYEESPRDPLMLVFERPKVEDEVLMTRLRSGMTRMADLLHMYNGSDHSVSARAVLTDERLDLRMGAFQYDRRSIMQSSAPLSNSGNRIALIETEHHNNSEERLAALIGVVSALDPLGSTSS